MPWIVGYAAGTQNAEQAHETIEALPAYEPLPEPGAHESDVDLVIGQVFAQGGQPARARPYLERAAHSCLLLENPYATLYAKRRLGDLLLATGEPARGRVELETLLSYWGEARPGSIFADAAREALRDEP
jgi:eukaryotic-like serine/threonine-protein kinase